MLTTATGKAILQPPSSRRRSTALSNCGSLLVTLAVELPSGIPLGGTGLAVFGFLGLFAMNHARLEKTAARTPKNSGTVYSTFPRSWMVPPTRVPDSSTGET